MCGWNGNAGADGLQYAGRRVSEGVEAGCDGDEDGFIGVGGRKGRGGMRGLQDKGNKRECRAEG